MENSIIIHNVSLEDFFQKFRLAIREEIQSTSSKPTEMPKYLTRREAADFLNISLATLLHYTKMGRVTGHRIGRRVLYKLEDLESNISVFEVSRYVKRKRTF